MFNVLEQIKKYWIPATLLILLAVTFLSLYPLAQLPGIPGTDKTHHLIAYFVLVFPTGIKKPKGWIWIILFFIFYSGMIELIQPYVNRYGQWMDFFANSIGIFFGLFTGFLLNQYSKHSIKKHKNSR